MADAGYSTSDTAHAVHLPAHRHRVDVGTGKSLHTDSFGLAWDRDQRIHGSQPGVGKKVNLGRGSEVLDTELSVASMEAMSCCRAPKVPGATKPEVPISHSDPSKPGSIGWPT